MLNTDRDVNYQAFKRDKALLQQLFPGYFVCYREGRIVGLHYDQETLREAVRHVYPHGPNNNLFIDQIKPNEKRPI